MPDALLTVAGAAIMLGLTEGSVLSLIASGKLRACNVSQGSQRPRWRIEPGELQAFLETRQTRPRVRNIRRRRRVQMVEYV